MMNTNSPTKQTRAPTRTQRGGVILGVIIGLLVGLGIALAVAVYVMKVPTPFNSKVTSRSAAQDAQEAKKNKDWDPNAALSGRPAVKSDVPADTRPAEAKPTETRPVVSATTPIAPTPPAPQAAATMPAQPATAGAPIPSGSPATATGSAEIEYFVQVAAFSNAAEAQAMRGKLALAGFEGRIVEREQSGRTVYRVRTGPFSQAAGDRAKAGLEAAGFDTVLVRSQR
jgi:cell division protein FtsN